MSLCVLNSWAQRVRLCREVASALAACHAAGVLHRDLTSFNVMLSDMQDMAQATSSDALNWHKRVRSRGSPQNKFDNCQARASAWNKAPLRAPMSGH